MTTVDLTKWPRLLVVGQDVTREQANEILVRTDSWYLTTNDKVWERAVWDLAGVSLTPNGWPTSEDMHALRASLRVLDLSYLHNERIASAWIGGPHGWCDWDGRIGCGSYNIGKWPGYDDVTRDWTAIAEAFPFLSLAAQLVADEGEGPLAGQWTVADGAVTFDAHPTERVAPSNDLSEEALISRFTSGYGERGVTLDRLAQALRQVRGGAS